MIDTDVIVLDGRHAKSLLQKGSDRRGIVNLIIRKGGSITYEDLRSEISGDSLRAIVLSLSNAGWLRIMPPEQFKKEKPTKTAVRKRKTTAREEDYVVLDGLAAFGPVEADSVEAAVLNQLVSLGGRAQVEELRPIPAASDALKALSSTGWIRIVKPKERDWQLPRRKKSA